MVGTKLCCAPSMQSPVACARWVRHAYARRGVIVRRLGCYGETVAASHDSHPSAWLSFASHDPCTRQWLPELSRRGTSASGNSKVHLGWWTCARALRGLPALTSKRYNTPV